MAIAAGHQRAVQMEGLLDLTLREITDSFGSEQGFADFVDVRKKIADTEARELAIALQRNLYVRRDWVTQHLIGLIQGLSHRLLHDVVSTICRENYSACRAGRPIEEAITATAGHIGRPITAAKHHLLKNIRRSGPATVAQTLPEEEEK